MLPHAAVGGCTPRPRNDRNDSRMITRATWSVATTTISETRFGRIWPNMRRAWLMPSARPAVMNSRSRMASGPARPARAAGGPAPAPDEAREEAAPDLVRAGEVLGGAARHPHRGREAMADVHHERIVRRDP